MASMGIEEFSFPKWYPAFEEHSIKAIVIPVPNEVIRYLDMEMMVLPAEASEITMNINGNRELNYSVDWATEDDSDELEVPTFPAFSKNLKDSMNSLGGEVFIKANWHAPIDATWIVPGRTLKCCSLQDIYLLLKGSDIIGKDLCHEFKPSCNENVPCIVMKQWINIHPGCEFRCFVKQHELVAVSQRDCRSCYENLNEQKYNILKDITRFFKKNIKKRFSLPNYVFDIAQIGKKTIVIIDFQPLNKMYTDSLLFSWDELNNMKSNAGNESMFDSSSKEKVPENENEDEPEFRFLADDPGMQRLSCQISGLPYDLTQACSDMSYLSLDTFISKLDSEP